MNKLFVSASLLSLAIVGFAADTTPEAAFIAAYKDAVEHRDLKKLNQLRCWDGVTPETRRMMETDTHEFDQKIKSIKIAPPTNDPRLPMEYTEDGVTYGPNMKIVAALHVEYVTSEPGEESRSEQPLGLKDGKYLMASDAPIHK